jgi:RNA polymerase sigma-70 factor (ECF subfamily)
MPVEIRQDLIKSIKDGDRKSFGILIDQCSQYVYKISLKMIGDVDDAKDAAQDTFVKVWQKIHTYNGSVKFTTWVYKITMNTCLDKIRKSKRHYNVVREMDLQNDQQVESTSNQAVRYEEKQLIEFIKNISSTLSAKQHAVFVLHDLEDFTHEEIAEIIGMSKNRVKSNLYYARKAIRHKLKLSNEKITANYEM